MKRMKVAIVITTMVFMLWASNLHAFKNSELVNAALNHLDQTDFQCKEFLYHLVNEELNESLGAGFRACYLNAGYEVFSRRSRSRRHHSDEL